MPSTHIGPVRGLSSYEPASLADVPDNDDEADPARPSSPSTRLGKGRQSVDHQRRGSDWGSDDEDDGWDAWDDGGPTEDGPLRGGSREIRRSLDEDGGDGDMEQEMKDLEEAGREGVVSSEKELKKKLYWREAMITGFFVLLWFVRRPLISQEKSPSMTICSAASSQVHVLDAYFGEFLSTCSAAQRAKY